jgi:two-component system cell cycle sensor histidine kinase/response regulator CckA
MCLRTVVAAEEGTSWTYDVDAAALRGAETILFVEDEAFVRDVTSDVLRSAGYTVLTARNPSEALIAYGEHPGAVKLLLADVVLPGETGRVLADRLRTRNPKLRVLFVTGYAEQMGPSDEHDGDCLAKPFSTALLLRKIRRVLDCEQMLAGEQSHVRHAAGNA